MPGCRNSDPIYAQLARSVSAVSEQKYVPERDLRESLDPSVTMNTFSSESLLPRETKTVEGDGQGPTGMSRRPDTDRLRPRAGSVERVGWGGIGMSDIFRDRLRPAATRTDGWDGNQYSSGISESETPSERPPGSNSRSSRSAIRSDAAGRPCSPATTETARVTGVTVPWAPPRYLENRSTGVPRTRLLRDTVTAVTARKPTAQRCLLPTTPIAVVRGECGQDAERFTKSAS